MIILNKKNINILCMLVVVFVLLSVALTYKDNLYNKEELNLNRINDTTNDVFHVNRNKTMNNSNYLRFLESFEDKINPEPYNPAGVYSNNINKLERNPTDERTERRLRTVFELMTENHPDPFNTKPKFI